MLFSILVLSIPNRLESSQRLLKKLHGQIGDRKDIEVLMFYDNKRRSIGAKRQALLEQARGKYLTFIDDDDDICATYMQEVIKGTEITLYTPDVITFQVITSLNGENEFLVTHGLAYENEPVRKVGDKWVGIKRKPFHTAVWRSEIAKSERFADVSYVEDWDWLKRIIPKAKTEHHIDMPLLIYKYDESVSESADSVNFRTTMEGYRQ